MLPEALTGAVVLQIDSKSLIVTLEAFWAEQFVGGEPTIALRTLEGMALSGRLIGAFRFPDSRVWWVNKLAMMQLGIQWTGSGKAAETGECDEEAEGERRSRDGEDSAGRGAVPRQKAKARAPAPCRYSP